MLLRMQIFAASESCMDPLASPSCQHVSPGVVVNGYGQSQSCAVHPSSLLARCFVCLFVVVVVVDWCATPFGYLEAIPPNGQRDASTPCARPSQLLVVRCSNTHPGRCAWQNKLLGNAQVLTPRKNSVHASTNPCMHDRIDRYSWIRG